MPRPDVAISRRLALREFVLFLSKKMQLRRYLGWTRSGRKIRMKVIRGSAGVTSPPKIHSSLPRRPGMARMGAAVPPLHAAVSGRAASTRKLPVSRHARILTRVALTLLAFLASALVITDTLLDLYAARELHLGQALEQADATAALIAQRLDDLSGAAPNLSKPPGDANSSNEPAIANARTLNVQALLTASLPFHASTNDTLVGVSDRSGQVVASLGLQPRSHRSRILSGASMSPRRPHGRRPLRHARRCRFHRRRCATSPRRWARSPSLRRPRAFSRSGARMPSSSLASRRSAPASS